MDDKAEAIFAKWDGLLRRLARGVGAPEDPPTPSLTSPAEAKPEAGHMQERLPVEAWHSVPGCGCESCREGDRAWHPLEGCRCGECDFARKEGRQERPAVHRERLPSGPGIFAGELRYRYEEVLGDIAGALLILAGEADETQRKYGRGSVLIAGEAWEEASAMVRRACRELKSKRREL